MQEVTKKQFIEKLVTDAVRQDINNNRKTSIANARAINNAMPTICEGVEGLEAVKVYRGACGTIIYKEYMKQNMRNDINGVECAVDLKG